MMMPDINNWAFFCNPIHVPTTGIPNELRQCCDISGKVLSSHTVIYGRKTFSILHHTCSYVQCTVMYNFLSLNKECFSICICVIISILFNSTEVFYSVC